VADSGSSTNRPRDVFQSVANTALFSGMAGATIFVAMSNVTLSESAANRIKAILAKQPDKSYLRVSVEGGGCSGFSYKFDLDDTANPDDLIVERNGVAVLVDEMSLEFMDGSEIDFSTELIGAAFKINNPNATAGCGCGTSFAV
jgi:iron-sulfur cluster assembly accessory protein